MLNTKKWHAAFLVFPACAWADVDTAALDAAIARVKPALVQIHVVSAAYAEGREMKYESAGSGVIISKDGYILSNHHVAGHSKRLLCIMSDNEEIEARLIGTDALADISVIQLKPESPREFPVAEFGDSDAVQVGDTVLAMGSPMALSQSVTKGIISNTKMVMPMLFWPFNRFTLDGEDVGSIVRWIAHDAAIYGGNSGGPLVNMAGEVIGINEINMGLGGAIPGNLAREVSSALIKNGKVQRAWLGLGVQPLLKYGDQDKGILVSGVMADSPAEAAGFNSGDILLSLVGHEVNAHFHEELPLFNQYVADLPIGKTVDAQVLRDGSVITLQVTPTEREEMRPQEREIKELGLTVRDISYMMLKEMKLKSREGALVTSVRPGGPGGEAKPSLTMRDVVTSLDGKPVLSVSDLEKLTHETVRGHADPVPALLGFVRDNAEYVTVVKAGTKDIEDPGREVKKAWLPVAAQVITRDLADQLGNPELGGVRITQVYPGSTAEKAGLKIGDFIVGVDGEPLPVFQLEDYEILPALIRQYPVGAKPELSVLRGGKTLKKRVELVRAPMLEREMKLYRDDLFEFTARETTYFDQVREEWKPEDRGMLIGEVVPGGWAALGRLAVEDLLLSVDGHSVTNVAGLRDEMQRVGREKPKSVVLSILRGIHRLYIEIEPDWSGEE